MLLKTRLSEILFISLLSIATVACNSNSKKNSNVKKSDLISADTLNSLTFKDVEGIRFYEVKRRFNNGLSFNKDGFQQEPTWIIQYQYPDTMLAYSPEKKGMEHFYLQYDHGRVYNFAREFFRAVKITKDSLILQRLEVNARVIKNDERSDVYCVYYTKNYIENKLKTTVGELQRPSKADTAYIRKLTAISNKYPSNADSAFAARQPVNFRPNSPNVTVEKINTHDDLTNRKSYDYMYPEYKMVINKSYRDFSYRFSVVVDAKGNLHVNRVEGVMDDDIPHRKKLLQGIVDVYVKNLFYIKPGTTLDIPHPSEITLNLVGKTAK